VSTKRDKGYSLTKRNACFQLRFIIFNIVEEWERVRARERCMAGNGSVVGEVNEDN
jgi:hypothetical protein